ncbi:MAG: prepilin peptidase [Candidatus Parcubacteria bacterium]|nr:MAG: prepilin peptidase [Candidatus Parcubacteria bacterium]
MIYFILGLFLGSLVNNIAYRLVRNQNFISDSSRCDYCQKKLSWYELIPIISYVIQLGQCRNCKNKISIRYPLTEITIGLLTYKIAEKSLILLSFNIYNLLFFLYFLTIILLFFILVLYDLETFYIEEKIVYLSLLSWLMFIFIFYYLKVFPQINFFNFFDYFFYLPQLNVKDYALNRLYFAFVISLSILILFVITLGKGIGLGDVKLFFILGLYFNFGDLLFTSLITILIGGLFSLIILIKKRKFKQAIPFGPFIFLGLFVTILIGDDLSRIIAKNLTII